MTPLAGDLLVDRLGEGQHVRLRGGVTGRVRERLHPGRRGDVQDRAAAALHHPRQERGGERDHCLDQDLDLLEFAGRIRLGECPTGREARVVDQDLDVEPEFGDAAGNPGPRCRLG